MSDFMEFIRPSSLHAISLCNGRPKMEAAFTERFGKEKESPEASAGTLLHTLVETCIRRWIVCQESGERGAEWFDAIAITLEDAETNHPDLTSYDLWCVKFACEYARDLIQQHGIEPDNVLVEQKLGMAAQNIGRGGTADLVLVVPFKFIVVVDWKFGHLEQDSAEDNDQLAAYAAAAAETFKTRHVEVHIVQPRAEKHARATAATFNAEALDAQNAWTRAVVALASKPNPELAPSYDACKYCRAFTRCAAAKELIVKTNEALEFLGQPQDADQWGELAGVAKLAEKFGERGVDEVKAHLNSGGSATGWKMAPSGTMRTCLNPRGVFNRLMEKGYDQQVLSAIKIDLGKLPPDAQDLVGEFIEVKEKAKCLKPAKVGKGEM